MWRLHVLPVIIIHIFYLTMPQSFLLQYRSAPKKRLNHKIYNYQFFCYPLKILSGPSLRDACQVHFHDITQYVCINRWNKTDIPAFCKVV